MTERKGLWQLMGRGGLLGLTLLLSAPLTSAAPRPEMRLPPPPGGEDEPWVDPLSVPVLVKDLGSGDTPEARFAARELRRQAERAAWTADHMAAGRERTLEAALALDELDRLALVPCIEALAFPRTARSCAAVLVALQNPAGLAPLEAAASAHGGMLGRQLTREFERLRAVLEPT